MIKNSIAKKLSLLNETILECVSLSNEKQIVKKFVESGINTLNANYGYSWFRENEDTDFRWLYKSKSTPYTPAQPRKNGVMSKTFKSKIPTFFEDVFKAGVVREDAKRNMKSVVVIPVTYKENNYGTLVICFTKLRKFTAEERNLCIFIGNSAAQAITIFRLYYKLESKVKQRTEELSTANQKLKNEIIQRRTIERKLKESEIRFRSLLENTLDIFTIITTEGVVVYESMSIKRVLGYEPGELIGKNVFEYVHPEDLPNVLEIFTKVLVDTTKTYRVEFRFQNKAGEWRVLESIGQNFAENKIIGGIVVNSRDITERKAVEQKLGESQKLLSQAQSIAHIGSWEWDMPSKKICWSDELCKIYNVEKGFEGTLDQYLSFVHPAERIFVKNKILKAVKEKNPFEYYYKIVRQDGKIRTLHARGDFILNDQKEIIKLVGTGQDVTEIKEAEAKLKNYTRQLEINKTKIELDKAQDEALLSSIGEGIIAIDPQGKVILVNPQAEKIIGFHSGEVLGKQLFDAQPLYNEKFEIISKNKRPTYIALKSGKSTIIGKENNVYYKKGDGIFVPVSITATPILLKNKIIGSIQVFRDITKEKEIDRAKSELISLASHQLRTPLSAINWYSEALLKGEIGPISKHQKQYLEQIAHANQKMVELVYDFLNVSRIELGTFSIKLANLDVLEIIKGILKEIKPIILGKKLNIKEVFDKNISAIEGDRKIIRLILQNLITNAVKYTPAKGTVNINVTVKQKSKSGHFLNITISDTGYGIPKNQQSKIFTKLFRADNVATLDTEGSGLGLYLVKSFVDLCKGKIWFTSKENKGTSFYVQIPVKIVPKKAVTLAKGS